ncbi:tetratricopeptide repeat protein [Burkholderia ubonensis]|uniref:tetratricopeptide repeat protein n=1 Tax=Burkholderia ubonensis TaxID=101571 RepID=UPI002ABD4FE8|nr:tetratricopeptide repeat protein [Burkholderia ubonensis]
MLEDRYGLPLSTSSQAARDAYVRGVDSVISGVAGYREDLAVALKADPAFALAHIALARGMFLDGDLLPARELATKARQMVASATPREQSHVNVVALGMEGKPVQAIQAMHEHLKTWPRDAMVLAPATSVFGLYGFSGAPDREEQLYQLLASLAPAYGNDWWFDTVYGFAACETGRLDEAWTLIERALAANPRHAHAAHFRAHVMYERGESAAILDFLEGWMPHHDTRSLTHCHLSWHMALAALAVGRLERAWDAYRTSVCPGGAWGPPINVVTDSASFLWRAELAGHPRDATAWRVVHDHAQRCFPNAGLGYADVHALIACIADDDNEALQTRLAEIRDKLTVSKYPAGDVVIGIAEGFAAYAAEEWGNAIHALESALPKTVRIGGSRAQRDLIELTLVAAYIKNGRPDAARALIDRRHVRHAAVSVAGYHESSGNDRGRH